MYGIRHRTSGVIVACKGSEDKRCADQWTFLENFEDHYIYLGIRGKGRMKERIEEGKEDKTRYVSYITREKADIAMIMIDQIGSK